MPRAALPTPPPPGCILSPQVLEDLHAQGKARAIGVSNFEEPHLRQLLAAARVRPAANQFEAHPRRPNAALRELCAAEGVAVVAYASLGCGQLLAAPAVARVAEETGRTPAQVGRSGAGVAALGARRARGRLWRLHGAAMGARCRSPWHSGLVERPLTDADLGPAGSNAACRRARRSCCAGACSAAAPSSPNPSTLRACASSRPPRCWAAGSCPRRRWRRSTLWRTAPSSAGTPPASCDVLCSVASTLAAGPHAAIPARRQRSPCTPALGNAQTTTPPTRGRGYPKAPADLGQQRVVQSAGRTRSDPGTQPSCSHQTIRRPARVKPGVIQHDICSIYAFQICRSHSRVCHTSKRRLAPIYQRK